MEKLRQVLKQSDTVLFIGSGISTWSGLPSWAEAVEKLAQFLAASGVNPDLVRAEAVKGDLIQAASYGLDQLTKQQLGEFIWGLCLGGGARPEEIHRKIVSLGPRYFITTNYDDLIEKSLRKWHESRPFRTVTNRQLTETAAIAQTHARDYVFKPHGDAGDVDSIIMSRYQYRALLPQGDLHAALKALEILLVSRPVVYLGFGLRDPDFMYVRDTLLNTFQGGTRDHYAVMADVSEGERDYWRRQYGIHIVGYATKPGLDGQRDHTNLLALLDDLVEKAGDVSSDDFDPSGSDFVLALARHAGRLMGGDAHSNELQLRVHAERAIPGSTGRRDWLDRFDHSPVERFLDSGPARTLLIGMPGAGKSYAVRRSASRLAMELNKSCLAESFQSESVVVPILADLKMYRGNLTELVNQALPAGLPYEMLSKHFKVKIFLDSFNEMPQQYLESGTAESDLAKFEAGLGKASIVIASRTVDGLQGLGLSTYTLDHVDEKDVVSELKRVKFEIAGTFSHEVMALLQRPFYLEYVTSGAIQLPEEAHPRDFYRALLQNVDKAFGARFGTELEIETALARVAYDAIDRGEEAFALEEFLRSFGPDGGGSTAGINGIEVANWLVSCSMFVPYSGGRVAFVHQSVTEFLAASELARRYESNPRVLKEKLTNRRWDQALFLCLSLLPTSVGEAFLDDVIEADFALGLRAAKYLEVGRDEVVARLLAEIPRRIHKLDSFERKIESAVEFSLPIGDVHEDHLRALIALGDSMGAVGVSRLVELKGEEVKDELIQLLVDRCDDFNLCVNGVAPALKSFALDTDVQRIVAWADSIEAGLGPRARAEDTHGFILGAAKFLSQIDLAVVRRGLLGEKPGAEISDFRSRLLCNVLQDRRSTAALDLAGDLVLRGIPEAAVSLYFIAAFSEPRNELCWVSFSSDHVRGLISMLDAEDNWALRALKHLCTARPDLAEIVEREAKGMSGINKAALMHCISPEEHEPVFQALEALVGMSAEELKRQPVKMLEQIEYDWSGREGLFVNLLRLRDVRLARAILGDSAPPMLSSLGNLDIGPIDWWLDWMMDELAEDGDAWFLNQLGGLFGYHLSAEVQGDFVAEFNKQSSKFRRILLHFVVPTLPDVSTDAFSEDAISSLLADLDRESGAAGFESQVLGNTATEKFVTERLLPLLAGAKEPRLSKLQWVLRQAGSRHNRRYYVTQQRHTNPPSSA